MARRSSRPRSRSKGGGLSRALGEISLSIRTAVWIGGKMARAVRSDLRRQVALAQRRGR